MQENWSKTASIFGGRALNLFLNNNLVNQGFWELVVDLDTNKIVHFNFTE